MTTRSVSFMKICCSVLALAAAAGCEVNTGLTEKKVLEQDPSFQAVLKERDSYQAKADSSKMVFKQKVQEIDFQISSLQQNKALLKAEYLEFVDKMRKQLDPTIRGLEQDQMELEGELKVKAIEMKNLTRDIAEIDSLVKKKDTLQLTMEEKDAWNKRLTTLLSKKNRLEQEMNKIRQKIQLISMKIKVLDIH